MPSIFPNIYVKFKEDKKDIDGISFNKECIGDIEFTKDGLAIFFRKSGENKEIEMVINMSEVMYIDFSSNEFPIMGDEVKTIVLK